MRVTKHSLLTAAIAAALLTAFAPMENNAKATGPTPDSATSSTHEPSTQPTESKAQRDARMAWWRAARFGMFIHWGIYSVPAGIYHDQKVTKGPGEWIMLQARIPVAEYAQFADQFDAKDFDADRWVTLAKDAGMKYMVITAKHHDGFAMFHTAVDHYNIYDATPFHRDPIAELAAACKKQGIRFGIYYSQSQDWHHAGGASLHTEHWDPAQNGDFATYLKNVAEPQVRELLTKYGPLAEIWFDTATDKMTHDLATPFAEMIKQYQPEAIVNNRLGGGWKEDFGTPEQFVPAMGLPGEDWETCMTINNTWGYRSWDDKFKSGKDIIRLLCETASKGGNYLLNVGPDSHGDIPKAEIDDLHTVGDWLKINGQAIYGTTASPFPLQLPFGRVTSGASKLFLEVFDWPADHRVWLPISNVEAVKKAYLLTSPDKPLAFASGDGGVTIELPDAAADPSATVVVVEHDSPLQTFAQPIDVVSGKTFTLDPSNGVMQGVTSGAITTPNAKVPVTVMSDESNAVWKIRTGAKVSFNVDADLVAMPKDAGTITLAAGEQKLSATLTATDGIDNVAKTLPLGVVTIPAGTTEVTFTTESVVRQGKLRLHSITLNPATQPVPN